MTATGHLRRGTSTALEQALADAIGSHDPYGETEITVTLRRVKRAGMVVVEWEARP